MVLIGCRSFAASRLNSEPPPKFACGTTHGNAAPSARTTASFRALRRGQCKLNRSCIKANASGPASHVKRSVIQQLSEGFRACVACHGPNTRGAQVISAVYASIHHLAPAGTHIIRPPMKEQLGRGKGNNNDGFPLRTSCVASLR